MGFDQYHEPPEELTEKTRTFARMITSVIEEAEAIGWYEQRMSVEADRDARAIMADTQGEEFKHFCMDLEFLLRRTDLNRVLRWLQDRYARRPLSDHLIRTKWPTMFNPITYAGMLRLGIIAAKVVTGRKIRRRPL